MEADGDSRAEFPLKYDFSFINVNAIKEEPIIDEEEVVKAKVKEEWCEVNIKIEHIDTSDIKEEPATISACKAEVPCSSCNQLEEGVFFLLSNRGANPTKDLSKTIPKSYFEIKQNISVLKCIPENIIFGPYAGLQSLRNSTSLVWILNGGRQAEVDNKHLHNWMQFIPFSTNKSGCNLKVFQFNRLLYFQTIRSIVCKEELLAYLDEQLVKDFSNDAGKYYYPLEENVPQTYGCIPCCLGFSTDEYLRKHLTNCISNVNEHLADIVQCPVCKMVSFDRKHLKYHLKNNCVNNKSTSHISCDYKSAELHKCDVCDMVYKRKAYLSLHMNTHKKEKRFSCNQCDYKTNVKGYLRSHVIARHTKEYACAQCDFVTKRRRDLKLHRINAHSTIKRSDIIRHDIESKSTSITESTNENDTNFKTKKFKCSICNQELSERTTLRRHVRAVHVGEKLHPCEYCDYKCASSGSLTKHMKTHTKEKPYMCQICNRAFMERYNLKRHITIHVKEGYPCLKCHYRAPSTAALDTHMERKHST